MARSDEERPIIPPGWHTVTPRIVVTDPTGLEGFIQAVFHAWANFELERPTVLVIGDSTLMLSGAAKRECRAAFLYVYVSQHMGNRQLRLTDQHLGEINMRLAIALSLVAGLAIPGGAVEARG